MNKKHNKLPAAVLSLVLSRGICNLGATLTAFGLDVWVFRQTGSYATFAYLAVLTALPSLLFAPFAGVIADRWDKKKLLLGCDLVSMFIVACTLALHLSDALVVPFVALTILLLSMASEMRWAVLGVAITMITPPQHLGRINGLQQALRGMTVMLGPVLGAIGLDAIGLNLLLGLNVFSYVIGVLGLLGVQIVARANAVAVPVVFSNFWQELTFGFRWTFAHSGLRRLLLFFMAINIGVSVFTVTFTPYILTFANTRLLGISLALQGAGSFVMGIFLAQLRRHGSDEARVLLGAMGFGLCMFAWGFTRQQAAVLSIAFALGMFATIVMAASQTIWQTQVPTAIQGKVFAVRTVLSFGLAPLAILFSVPFASLVFEPLLRNSILLSGFWGTSMTGSLGLMVSTLGIAVMLAALALLIAGGLRLQAETRHELVNY